MSEKTHQSIHGMDRLQMALKKRDYQKKKKTKMETQNWDLKGELGLKKKKKK